VLGDSIMVVWGGYGCVSSSDCTANVYHGDGGRYDITSNTWLSPPSVTADTPSARSRHSMITTRAGVFSVAVSMVVWGGFNGSVPLGDGSAYDLAMDTWRKVSEIGAPTPRYWHTAVWAGDASSGKMIVWGGLGASGAEATGGVYRPACP
jgi:hypothetical protein